VRIAVAVEIGDVVTVGTTRREVGNWSAEHPIAMLALAGDFVIAADEVGARDAVHIEKD
jgi:hypothetical protein